MPRRSTALNRELRVIRKSFLKLASAFTRIVPLLGEGAMGMATAQEYTKRGRRKPRLSAQQRAPLKLQGKYMGTMRGLKPRQRAQVKKIRASKGIRAAIKAAAKLAGSAS